MRRYRRGWDVQIGGKFNYSFKKETFFKVLQITLRCYVLLLILLIIVRLH